MQASSNLPALPLSPPDLEGATPVDVLSMIAGTQQVVLRGFADSTASKGSWSHPATPFVGAREFDQATPEIDRSRVIWRRIVLFLSGLALLVSGLAMGFLGATSLVRWASDVSPSQWRISRVQPDGVQISFGGRLTVIPVGGRLPNGDPVVAVYPDRDVVVLESATFKLRSLPGAVSEETK